MLVELRPGSGEPGQFDAVLVAQGNEMAWVRCKRDPSGVVCAYDGAARDKRDLDGILAALQALFVAGQFVLVEGLAGNVRSLAQGQELIATAVMVDGVPRPVHNAKGQIISADVQELCEFWRWFGDSTAVDTAGRPQVLYHGTQTWSRAGKQLGDIKRFNRLASTEIVGRRASIDTLGAWVSDRPDEHGAGRYAGGPSGVIYPLYVRTTCRRREWFDSILRSAWRYLHQSDDVPDCKTEVAVGISDVDPYRCALIGCGVDALEIVHNEASESTEFEVQRALVLLDPDEQIRFVCCPAYSPVNDGEVEGVELAQRQAFAHASVGFALRQRG